MRLLNPQRLFRKVCTPNPDPSPFEGEGGAAYAPTSIASAICTALSAAPLSS